MSTTASSQLAPRAATRGAETTAQTEDAVADPKERLLDAAEQIFAERGFEGTSMRAITTAAGMSVSSANYHFGSKEALLAATLRRHVEPVNRRRLERLDRLEAAAAPGAPDLEEVLGAFLHPAFEQPSEHAGIRTVMLRLFSDPKDRVDRLKIELFSELRGRFIEALRRALPEADETALALGFNFCLGVMLHVIAGHHVTESADTAPERASIAESILCYSAAGMRALVGDER